MCSNKVGIIGAMLLILVLKIALYFKGVKTTDSPSASGEFEDPHPESVGIMTFNIRTSLAHDAGTRGWQFRKQRVANIIKDNHPAVVGLQEPTGRQMADLEPLLGTHYEWFRAKRTSAPVGYHAYEYNPIVFDTRQVQLEKDGRFWLSESPQLKDSGSWGTAVPRVVNWGRFRRINAARKGNDSDVFYVFNLHMDHISGQARLRGADVILKQVREVVRSTADKTKEQPVVFLIGDFNCNRRSVPWRLLTGKAEFNGITGWFFDAWETAKCRVNPIKDTWHDFKGSNATDVEGSEHIDGILYLMLSNSKEEEQARRVTNKHVEVLEVTVVMDGNENGNFPSDHFPVMASFVFDTRLPL